MPFIEIVALAAVLCLMLSVVWSTLTTGIPPMISTNKARDAMLEAIPAGQGAIVDLGSGWGTLVISAAKRQPNRQVIGYELSYFPWLVSVGLKRLFKLHNLKIYRQDFQAANLNNAAVVCCYLMPKGMQALAEKLHAEQQRSLYVVSNTFGLPGQQALNTWRLNDLYRSPIYLYHYLATS